MIKVLEKNIADKIAAGEVIDRPVSIVKELVENAIDADSTSITIEIRDGGKSYIRVTDNGYGIPADQAETAFLRHATSKIDDVKDLNSINTLGFRGEALASICAVARVELISKCSDSREGCRIVIEGSRTVDNSACGCPEGTTITVRDLFFNLPARNKFMNSAASESRKIIDFASRIALAYPDIRFNVINGSSPVFTTSGKGNIHSNIISIYGSDIGKDLLTVESFRGDFILKGFVSDPGTSLASRSRQIFCVNGRIISSAVLERALDKAYKERLLSGRFPVAFLFLSMPPGKLDVNIHPAKKEIRFDDNGEVEDFVAEAVRKALMTETAIPEVRAADVGPLNSDEKQAQILKDGEFEYNTYSHTTHHTQEECVKGEQVDINNLLTTLRETVQNRPVKDAAEQVRIPATHPFEFSELDIIGCIFDTYIVSQLDNTIYLIDQHAAHERIFYEKLRKQYTDEKAAGQQLMLPLNFSVSSDVYATEDNWIHAVKSMGYDIEFFGGNTYIVREIPAFMEISEAEYFLNNLFSQFAEKPDLTNVSVMDKIIMKSCKSAVKAGDCLAESEISALISQLNECENPYSCPHGRPVFIKMTKHEIEKMFKRV